MSAQEPITLTAFGKTQTLYRWAREREIPYTTLYNRSLREERTPEDAILGIRSDLPPRMLERRRERQKKMALCRKLFWKGLDRDEIATRADISPGTVTQYLRCSGLTWRQRRRARQRQAWHLYQDRGMSGDEVAERLKVSSATVYRDLQAVQRDPSILMVDKAGYCDCGRESTICVRVKVRQGAKEVLELCAEHYAMFLEDERKTHGH